MYQDRSGNESSNPTMHNFQSAEMAIFEMAEAANPAQGKSPARGSRTRIHLDRRARLTPRQAHQPV